MTSDLDEYHERATRKAYSHPSSVKERKAPGDMKLDPVTAERRAGKARRDAVGAENRKRTLALQNELDQAMVRRGDAIPRGGEASDESRRKKLAEENKARLDDVDAVNRRKLAEVVKRHPVA